MQSRPTVTLPEMPVPQDYPETSGLSAVLAGKGLRILGVYRYEANARVFQGEAQFLVIPDGPEGPTRLTIGNPFGEDLVFIVSPST